MSTRRCRSLLAIAPASGLVFGTGLVLLTACSSSGGRTAEAYCGFVQERLTELNAPAITTVADIDLTLDLYRSVADRAPAAVEPEWQQLVVNLETASTVDPDDPSSVQRAADTARATTSAAIRVQEYTSATCALQLGPVPEVTLPPTTVGE